MFNHPLETSKNKLGRANSSPHSLVGHCQVNRLWRWEGELIDANGMTPQPSCYPRHRFPAKIIGHAVWL
jgi:hypothetical protein